ncbi:MAG TPA: hypothetical protein VFD92_28415 [Candidatus Binatia bacterium]|nr:hypothetical protein [Candidatus Binatia bacterium]
MPPGSEGPGSRARRAARARRTGAGARVPKKEARRHSPARSPRLEALAKELCELAERVGIHVRQERLLREVGYHTKSGLVWLDGAEILLLDHELAPDQKVELLTGVLGERDLAGVELSDDARQALAAPARRQRPPARARRGDAGESPAEGDADASERTTAS